MSVAEFGDLSPRELWVIVEAYNTKRQQAREDLVTQAWLTAAWQRTKQMPKLDRILGDMKPKEDHEQTPKEMLVSMQQWMGVTNDAGS